MNNDSLRFLVPLALLAVPIVASAGSDADDFLANPPRVVYIGTNDYPVEHAEAFEHAAIPMASLNLDAQRNLEERLGNNLPDDWEAAAAEIDRRFEAMEAEVDTVFHALMLTAKWDVKKTPAFVFDNGTAVIYGLTDARRALSAWRRWLKQKGGRAR